MNNAETWMICELYKLAMIGNDLHKEAIKEKDEIKSTNLALQANDSMYLLINGLQSLLKDVGKI